MHEKRCARNNVMRLPGTALALFCLYLSEQRRGFSASSLGFIAPFAR